MRKNIILLIIGIVLILGLSSCAAAERNYPGVDSNDKVDQTEQHSSTAAEEADKTEGRISENNSNPSGAVMPIYFKSEGELKDAILGKATLGHGPWKPEDVTSLKYYFIPENLPKESSLSNISVHEVNVAFCYQFDQSPDEWMSNVFLIEWFRTFKAGDMKENVKKMFSESEIEHYMDYDIYVYKVTDELEKKEYLRQDIFWEQNGYAFHAIVPSWFTKDDIAKYCVAKKVDIIN